MPPLGLGTRNGGAPSAVLPRQPRLPVRPPARLNRRAVTAGASPNDTSKPRAPSGSGRLSRLLSWRSMQPPPAAEAKTSFSSGPATAAEADTVQQWEEEQQVAAAALSLEQQEQEQQPGVAAEQQPEGRRGEEGSSADEASQRSRRLAATAELADGMAAAEPQLSGGSTAPSRSSSSYWRNSWYSLSRSSLSTSGSFDEADPATAAAAAGARWQQRVPIDHPALQLLRQRALSSSRPGQRRDPFKLGLVVEGGGMRGCVSGGALQALTDLGLRDAFDAVYGSSAGAINSTYFLSGQREGVDIYHDHISTDEFISLKRLWKGRGGSTASASLSSTASSSGSMDEEPTPVLNLAFLIDHVMHSVQPLDWDAVLASPVPLKVVASSLDTLNSVLLHSFADRDDLANCLKASATVPEIAGGPRLHRGQRLVDAAVFEPVPFRSAIADGCTHLLVLCTRPLLLTRHSRVNAALADAMEVAIKKAVMSPDYMVPAWKAEVDYLAQDGLSQDDMLLKAATQEDAHTLPWFAGAHVLPLYPGTAANFSPLCTDPPTLKAGIAEGRRNVLAVCRALLGDARDFSRFPELESSNILPTRTPGSSARLWRRYLADDFSHHA